MTAVPLPAQINVGSFFLETLTTGMYESPFHCLREYIQNGFDAINDAVAGDLIAVEDGKITVSITGSGARQNISIRDNGGGAPATEAVDRFVSLGASHKRPQRHAGFRGIGRLAGIAYCTTLKFTTKAAGEADATITTFDCAKLRGFMAPGAAPRGVSEVIRECVTAATVASPVNSHFTDVEMIGLTGAGLEFTDLPRLVPYLSQYSPTDYAAHFPFADRIRSYAAGYGQTLPVVEVELKAKKDRVRITKLYQKSYPPPAEAVGARDASTLTDIQTVGSNEHGWFGWFGVSNFPGAIPDVNVMGIRFRQKNIQIGDNSIIEAIAAMRKSTDRTLQRWTVGEIFVTNTAVVPNARRDGFEDNEAWRQIQTDVAAVTQSLVKMIRNSSTQRNVLKKAGKAIAHRRDKLKEPGSTLDEATRQAVDKELTAQLEKIEKAVKGGADSKEAAELVAQIKELRETIKEAAKSPPAGGASPNTASADYDSEPENWVLAIVREIITEKLGEERADELMEAIYARLSND